MTAFELTPIGRVESSLTSLEAAPRQADEGAPDAWLVFEADVVKRFAVSGSVSAWS